MHETRVSDSPQDLRRSIGGMVVDNDHVVGKPCFLAERALNGVENRTFTIAYRNNDAGLNGVRRVTSRDGTKLGRQPRADATQMCGGYLLHFDLIIAVAGIDVIELSFAGWTRVHNRRDVKRMGQ